MFDGKSFHVTGEADTVLSSVCARCDEAFQEQFRCSFSERFVKIAELDEESDDYSYEGGTLVIDDAVMDNLLLALPLVSVCSESCKGLCPVCGANLNEADCGHAAQIEAEREQDRLDASPFAALRNLDLGDGE